MKIKFVRTNDVFIAGATSLLWWKRVRVSDKFYALPEDQQFAVLMHEFGHLYHHHTEKRILCLVFSPWRLIETMKRQEFEADRYAASQGCADALIEVLKGKSDGGLFHPSNFERREVLKTYEHPAQSPLRAKPRTVGVTD
jgi:Zn-dependent protease with chaperone function